MKIKRTIIILDAANLADESAFWANLLGGVVDAEDEFHSVTVNGEWRLGIQFAPNHVAPEWPSGAQQQQIHIDVWVDDLKEAHERVVGLGGTLLKPSEDPSAQEQFQVYADPAGHPFCLCWAAADN